MDSLKIILLSIAAAVAYGIIHDQITARICVEYFTIGHPPVFGTDDPTLLGIGWGMSGCSWARCWPLSHGPASCQDGARHRSSDQLSC